MDTVRRAQRANLLELEVMTSIAELLARAGECEGFDALAPNDPSGEMTRVAVVDDGAGGVRVEWGTVADSDEGAERREERDFDEPHFEGGQLAYCVLSALDGPDGDGAGWLSKALKDGGVLATVDGPLRALVGTTPDLYLVRSTNEERATLESLTTGATASMSRTVLTPTPVRGDVMPLRRWVFGKSELWLPAGKPLSRSAAEDLLERVRAQFGGVDAGALRSASATILRESFVLASPDADEL
jgi:hypothetical protein